MKRVVLCMLVSGTLLVAAGCGGRSAVTTVPTTTSTAVASTLTPSTPTPTPSSTGAPSTTAPTPSSTVVTAGSGAPDPILHTPKNGSPEFTAILDALRVPVQQKLDQKVLFVVDRVTVQDGFAFLGGRPVRPSGAAVDYSGTPYKAQVDAGAFDDAIYALLRWTDGSWKVLTYNIGATDVTWSPWAPEFGAPEAIFPSLGN